MKMLFDNVLLEEIKEESKVITIGETKKQAIKGKVISVGPGQAYGLPVFEITTVEKDNLVYFLKDVAFKVEIDGKEFWVCRERDCLCIL